MSLFLPTYFAPISQYMEIANTDKIIFEAEDNYQKQTYRNRCYIYGPNGKQLLNIPVLHSKSNVKKKTKDALIDYQSPWLQQHQKSIQIAYQNSPFYEFYEDDLQKIFEKKHTYLLDLNIATHLFVMDALQLDIPFSKTSEYLTTTDKDFRFLANAKQDHGINFDAYIQMFDDKHGFLKNLSVLDLIFMEGPNTISFLEKKH